MDIRNDILKRFNKLRLTDDADELAIMLANPEVSSTLRDDDLTDLLVQSCNANCVNMTKALLDAGASPGTHGKFAPIHAAVRSAAPDAFAALLERGVDARMLDGEQCNILHLTFLFYSEYQKKPGGDAAAAQVISRALDGGLKVNQVFGNGISPIRLAITARAPIALLEVLAARGARLTQRDKSGHEPIHVAAMVGNHEAVTFLIQHGISPDDHDGEGMTALHHSASPKVAEVLLAHGANIDAEDMHGRTPLALQLSTLRQDQSIETISYLIQAGASLDRPTLAGETPQSIIARRRLKSVRAAIAASTARAAVQKTAARTLEHATPRRL